MGVHSLQGLIKECCFIVQKVMGFFFFFFFFFWFFFLGRSKGLKHADTERREGKGSRVH